MFGVGRLDKAIEHSPPLAWHLAPAELTQPGNELVPGQHGQAARILDDRHQGPLGVDGQDGDGTVLRVTAQPPGPRQDPAQQLPGRFGLDPEPFHKTLQRVPREPDRAVIALTCGKHLGQSTSLTWHDLRFNSLPRGSLATPSAPGRASQPASGAVLRPWPTCELPFLIVRLILNGPPTGTPTSLPSKKVTRSASCLLVFGSWFSATTAASTTVASLADSSSAMAITARPLTLR